MAERKRRADDDTVDAVDAVDEDLDEATADAPADEDEKPARKSRAKAEVKKKTDTKDARDSKDSKDAKKKGPKGKSTGKGEKERRPADGGRRGPIARIGRFIREVIAELRKVIWPNRKDLVTYAAVVIVFVAVMLTIVGFLDFGFAKATLAVFGSGSSK